MFPVNYSVVYKVPVTHKPPEDANELFVNTEYPNLNSRDYAMRITNHTLRMYPAWECIALNKCEHAIIATNKLNGREYFATLWGFEQLDEVTESKSCFKLRLESLVSCLKYVSQNICIIGLHSGRVQVYSTYVVGSHSEKRSPYCPFNIGDQWEHASSVNCLDVMNNKAATGSRDGMLKLWDMGTADLDSTHTFDFGHTDSVSDVAISENESLLVTCSLDKSVLQWDLRLPRPAMALFEEHRVGFNALTWSKKTDQSILYVGDESGYLHALDKRQPQKLLTSLSCLDRPIRKIIVKNKNAAIIGDTNKVKILTGKLLGINKIEETDFYENHETQSFVRDGVWRNDKEFLTIGFDSKIRFHQINAVTSNENVVFKE